MFKIKLGILKYNERYQIKQTPVRGYHETITLFFIKFVQRYHARLSLRDDELVRHLKPFIDDHPSFLPVLWEYYSRPTLNSVAARVQWIEPDLKPL